MDDVASDGSVDDVASGGSVAGQVSLLRGSILQRMKKEVQ